MYVAPLRLGPALTLLGEATLAIGLSDGRLCSQTIRQSTAASPDAARTETWAVGIAPLEEVDAGDGRGITAIAWLTVGAFYSAPLTPLNRQGILVWTKPGSVHLRPDDKDERFSWRETRSIVLGQIGNWAGATPYTNCIGKLLYGSTVRHS